MGSVLLVVGLIGGITSGLLGFLYGIPFQRWEFSHRGRQITVRNYAMRETISVDGVVVNDTRRDGDTTWAHHVVPLDGADLHIGIRSDNGISVHCEAAEGATLVFDSRDRVRLIARATSATAQPVETDPRDAALTALVAELAQSHDPEVMARAEALGEHAQHLLARIARTQRASDLHTALGGGEEVAVLLSSLEAELAPVLAELRALHLSGTVASTTQQVALPESGTSAAASELEPLRRPPAVKATG